MNDKPMSEAEFEVLIKHFNEDTFNYNEHTPLLFGEIVRLKRELERCHELAKVVRRIANLLPWMFSPNHVALLKELEENK